MHWGLRRILAPRKRPHGRTLQDFRQEDTDFKLLPAEEKLLADVAAGSTCDLGNYEKRRNLRKQLDDLADSPEILGLAAQVVAHPSQLFGFNFEESEEDRKSRTEIEAGIVALPRIVQEFVKETPAFARRTLRPANDLKERVSKDSKILQPVLAELKSRFELEIYQWRQVDPDDRDACLSP